MLKPVFDLAGEIVQQGGAARKSGAARVVDETFDKIFARVEQQARIHEDRRGASSRSQDAPPPGPKEDIAQDRPPAPERAESADRPEPREEPQNERKPEKAEKRGKDGADTKQSGGEPQTIEEAAEAVAGKIEELKEKDPEAYEKLAAAMAEMTFGELLAALGVSGESAQALEKLLDTDAKITTQVKDALLSGRRDETLAALKALGAGSEAAGKIMEAPDTAGAKGGTPLKNTREAITTPAAQNNNSNQTLTRAVNLQAAGGQGEAAQATAPNPLHRGADMAAIAQEGAQNRASIDVKATQGAQSGDLGALAEGKENTNAKAAAPEKPAEAHRRSFERMLTNQVVEKIRINVLSNGRSNMTIKLDPPSLGRIDMRVVTHENQVKAFMVAESHEVKAILERDLESLRNSLNNSGLKVDQITVTTSEESFNFRNETLGGRHGGSGHGRSVSSNDDASGENGPGGLETVAGARVSYHNGILDVMA